MYGVKNKENLFSGGRLKIIKVTNSAEFTELKLWLSIVTCSGLVMDFLGMMVLSFDCISQHLIA